MTFEQYLQELAPPWLLRLRSALWIQGHGATFDEALARAVEAVSARFVAVAPVDALYRLGEERGLPTYGQEPPESYRERVQGAWDYWRWAGTNEGIRRVLRQLGYEATITEYPGTPHWAEFSIAVTAVDITASAATYDDDVTVYDAETPYDATIRAAEPERLRGIVNSMKSAQSKIREFKLVTDNPNVYDDDALAYDAEDLYYLDEDEIPL